MDRDMYAQHGKIERFEFRDLAPHVFLGTASDRYAGWIGQIYTRERYEGRIKSRKKTVGKKSFVENTLPVESVQEYFEHFPVLEIDYTFYFWAPDSKASSSSRSTSANRIGFHPKGSPKTSKDFSRQSPGTAATILSFEPKHTSAFRFFQFWKNMAQARFYPTGHGSRPLKNNGKNQAAESSAQGNSESFVL